MLEIVNFLYDFRCKYEGPCRVFMKTSFLYNKGRVLLAVPFTLAVIYFVPDSLAVLFILLFSWSILFWPWQPGEIISFAVASLFFLFQNYICLRAQIFEFRTKDFLLMPYYEPFLWGFYFMTLKRLTSDDERRGFALESKSVLGLLVTSVAFSLSSRSTDITIATTFSTLFLLALFHTRLDIYYAVLSLLLGFIVELFGVSLGFWRYPDPDFLGMPFWFATMWISAGLLGCRFLIPLGRWLSSKRAA
jgi:hypothetical protein